MMCYRDMTFCISKDCTNECGRQLTKEIIEAADKWWGEQGAPISVSTFCGEEKNEEIFNG